MSLHGKDVNQETIATAQVNEGLGRERRVQGALFIPQDKKVRCNRKVLDHILLWVSPLFPHLTIMNICHIEVSFIKPP